MDMDAIVKIIEGYKDVKVSSVSASGTKTSTTITIKARISQRQMPLVATKIFNKYDDIHYIRFIGGWFEYVYTRRTLSYLGYNLKKVD